VTALIATRIWLLSPHRLHDDLRGVYVPQGRGRAAIDIVIESGALYLVVQLIFVVLFAIHHPAQGIVSVIAVQIYVRRRIACFGCCFVDLCPPPYRVLRQHSSSSVLRSVCQTRSQGGLVLDLRRHSLIPKCALGTARLRSRTQASASATPGST
jgi:hypothetical protein